jgi:flagellar basal-body rod modification protein FlgD
MADYSAVNAAASTGAAASSISNRMESSRSSLADSEQTFLALMTTQLKNQDPLSPVDSNQFTQQIVQMTGVEQQLLTNDLLKVLVGMNDGGLSSQVGMIGKEVTTKSSSGTLTDKQLTFDYDMTKAAGTLKLEVVDVNGKVVATLNPTDLTKGEKSYKWDGKDSTGKQLEDGGAYALRVTATDTLGAKLAVVSTSQVKGIVTAVSLENGQQMVMVGGRKIPASDIISVAQVAVAANTNTNTAAGDAADTTTTPTTETQADAA